jgi:hypothetical protein
MHTGGVTAGQLFIFGTKENSYLDPNFIVCK